MATSVETGTNVRGATLARIGLVTTILAVVTALIPIGYWLYAQVATVQLTSLDQIKSVFSNGTIATIVAGVVGLISLIVCGVAVALAVKVTRIIASVVSLLVLLAVVVFGLLYLQPHINSLNTLNNKLVPFAQSLRDNCDTPLNKTTDDIADARYQARIYVADDASFAAAMPAAIAKLQADAGALATASSALSTLTVPDAKYQQLYDDCVSSVKNQSAFLTNSQAIPLPAPFSAALPSVSGIDLLKNAGAVAAGQAPIKVPAGTVQPLIDQALTAYLDAAAQSKLPQEGDALKADIRSQLTSAVSPFQVDADALVS
ncbi:MAG TPA: hypothetical protein VFU88_02340 [Ktedonobacterales bacterium]|nr:hypothetical protein [Ktedonobacterales bacterium]